jgi:RNA polymerase sigma-70 factor (ECF subfamily)
MAEQAPVSSKREAFADFGDDDASRWEVVARLYRSPLKRFFVNRVRNPEDAEDLVQKVFVRLIQRARGKPIEHVQRYLFQVATSVLYDERRRARVHHDAEHDMFEESEHMLRNDITPERVLLGEESVARIVAALRELPARTREIYFMRAMRHRKFIDIAARIGISKRAAQGHMARALMHLSRVLNDDETDD